MESKYRLSDFSTMSVICVVDKFIKSVDTMNDVVMVPSRLMNVEAHEKGEKLPLLLRGSSDPYTFYTILNNVKSNLVWGLSEGQETTVEKSNSDTSTWFVHSTNGKISSPESPVPTKDVKEPPLIKGHVRKTSSVSTASVASCLSETECERLSDGSDSGLETEEVEPVVELTSALRTHLIGLQNCLTRFTETAEYITEKYQEEVSA